MYLEPQNEALKELWSDSIFIFDTSALLTFYYFPREFRKEFFENTLKPIKSSVWIPHHVMYEFLNNREIKLTEINEKNYNKVLKDNISPITKNLKSITNFLVSFKDMTKNKDSHPYIEADTTQIIIDKLSKFKDDFEGYEKSISSEFEKRKNEILSVLKNDDVLDFIQSNLEIGKKFSFEEVMNIVKEGEIRYQNTIPPGYMDLKDKMGTQIYGDLIIWKQILQYAKLKKNQSFL